MREGEVVPITATSVLAASFEWPLAVAGVAGVTAIALWGLFRRGSIADRARSDYADELDDASD